MTSPLSNPQQGVVEIDGHIIPFSVRRSTRSLHAALHIHPRTGLEIVIPIRAPEALIDEVLHEKRGWLQQHVIDLQRAQYSRFPLRDGKLIPLRGKWYPIHISPPASQQKRPVASSHVHFDGSKIEVPTREPSSLKTALERW